jgi:hypothetical protein
VRGLRSLLVATDRGFDPIGVVRGAGVSARTSPHRRPPDADGAVQLRLEMEKRPQTCGGGEGILVDGLVLGTGVVRYSPALAPPSTVLNLRRDRRERSAPNGGTTRDAEAEHARSPRSPPRSAAGP